MRDDDGILAEVMMAEGTEAPEPKDPLLEQFVELRTYVEFSHKEVSKDLARLERKVDGGFDRVDTRFDRMERKIDALASVRRAAPRRRKP